MSGARTTVGQASAAGASGGAGGGSQPCVGHGGQRRRVDPVRGVASALAVLLSVWLLRGMLTLTSLLCVLWGGSGQLGGLGITPTPSQRASTAGTSAAGENALDQGLDEVVMERRRAMEAVHHATPVQPTL